MTAPQTRAIASQQLAIPTTFEIQDVAFYPQEQFYCGPTTLAETLNFYGHDVNPDRVAPAIFLPDRQGSLQIEMVAAMRQYGLLAYAEEGSLKQLLALIADGFPVIVLQNLGTSWYPRWHYALAIGYDLEQQEIILHTGVDRRRFVAMDLFENTWRRSNHWILVGTPPASSSSDFDPYLFTRAAQDLIAVGRQGDGLEALGTAAGQWPEYWLPYFLLGTHYLNENPDQALDWFANAPASAQRQTSFLNNHAYALFKTGDRQEAIRLIRKAIELEPDNSNLENSLREFDAASMENS